MANILLIEDEEVLAETLEIVLMKAGHNVTLASNGLVTNINTFKTSRPLIAHLVRATQRGIKYTIDNPTDAFNEALKQVPEAGGANKDREMQVLAETIKLMQPKEDDLEARSHRLGWTDVQVWADTQDLLYDAKIISKKGKINEIFTDQFIPAANR